MPRLRCSKRHRCWPPERETCNCPAGYWCSRRNGARRRRSTLIEALEHVAIAHLLRRGIAESGVVELKVIVPGGTCNRPQAVQRLIDIVDGKAHQSDGRRHSVDGEMGRVYFDQAFRCGEPQPAVARAPRGGMAIRGHFASTQAIGGSRIPSSESTRQPFAIAARNTGCGGEPQMSVIVIEDRVNSCAIQACACDGRKVLSHPTGSIHAPECRSTKFHRCAAAGQ